MRFYQQQTQVFELDENNHVEIDYWPQTDRNAAGHIGLTLVCNGVKTRVSYWHQRDIALCETDKLKMQYTGIDPFWVNSFRDDCLIEGYRHAATENPKLNARDILKKIAETGFDKALSPTQSIKLYSLNVKKMLDAFLEYKNNPHKWAFFSGHEYHAPGAHNCSSIALFLLYQGGIEKLAPSYSESLYQVGVAISTAACIVWPMTLLQNILMIWATAAAGAAIGGAVDGKNEVQPFLRVIQIQKRDSFATHFGLSAAAIFMSSIAALLYMPHFFSKRFTLPGNVMDIAATAAQSEMKRICHIKQPVMLTQTLQNRI